MEKKNKIILTSLHLKHGGVEMVITSLANALVEKGFDVEILCTYHLGAPAYPLNQKVKVTYLTHDVPNRQQFIEAVQSKNPIRIIREGIRAVQILRRKKSTMKLAIRGIREGVVISTRHEHTLLLSRYGNPKVKKIAQLHSDHAFNKKLIHEIQSGYQNIDYFILLTQQTTEEVSVFLQGYNKKTKCVTIPNFIIPPAINIPDHKKQQVIAAGRLHPDKDFSSLLRIWAKVIDTHPGWHLKIAGEGDLEQSLKQQAAALHIEDSVYFTGALEHSALLQEMADSACYVLTSVSESFGLVLVESMACGTPPIAFDVRVGPTAIIQDGVTGFLISDRSEDLFAEKLAYLMDNPKACKELAKQAQIRAKDFYKEKILDQWMKVLIP